MMPSGVRLSILEVEVAVAHPQDICQFRYPLLTFVRGQDQIKFEGWELVSAKFFAPRTFL